MHNSLKGPVFSVPMFFDGRDNIDYDSLGRYVETICKYDSIQAIYSMAYNTRYCQLTDVEVFQVNKFLYDIINKLGKLFIYGHPVNATSYHLKKYCELFSDLENSYISILYPERYFGITDAVLDYHLVPSEFGIPVIVHEMKLVSGFDGSLIDWPFELLDEVLSFDGVKGIKEDSKNDEISKYILQKYSNKKDVIVAGGGKIRAMELRKHGLKTWLNGSLMMFPELTNYFCSAFDAHDDKLISNYVDFVERPLFEKIVARYGWHVAHKAVLAVRQFCEYRERSPMAKLSDSAIDGIRIEVAKIEENIERYLLV